MSVLRCRPTGPGPQGLGPALIVAIALAAPAPDAAADVVARAPDPPPTDCPEGSRGVPGTPHGAAGTCAPTDRCATSAECGAEGPCAERALCVGEQTRRGARLEVVLGPCVSGACPFGRCDVARRCRGPAPAERVDPETAGALLERMRTGGDAPAPPGMAERDPEIPPAPRAPAPADASPDGCGCRATGRSSAPGALLAAGLALIAARRLRR